MGLGESIPQKTNFLKLCVECPIKFLVSQKFRTLSRLQMASDRKSTKVEHILISNFRRGPFSSSKLYDDSLTVFI